MSRVIERFYICGLKIHGMGTLGSGVSLWVSQAFTSVHGLEVVLTVQRGPVSVMEAGPAYAWEG